MLTNFIKIDKYVVNIVSMKNILHLANYVSLSHNLGVIDVSFWDFETHKQGHKRDTELTIVFIIYIFHHYLLLQVLMLLPQPTPAPVPRCSPFIIINKLAEFNNLMSDSNPYFPMPPCEYGSWQNALRKGDFRSVFVLAEPQKIPLHNFYEFIWFLKTGLPRIARFLTGKQKFITDNRILREGYQHHTP